MNLDERLQNITRPERSTIQKEETKDLVLRKLDQHKKRSSWSYGFVLLGACTILLFFIVTMYSLPLSKTEQTLSPFGSIDENTIIEKVILLENSNPVRNLNVNSIFYPLKKSATESEQFKKLLQILQSAKGQGVAWDGTIENEYSVDDIYFKFSNGEELYVKLDTTDVTYLIDPYSKMKYELSKQESSVFYKLTNELTLKNKWSTGKKLIFAFIIVVFVGLSILFEQIEKKKQKEKEQEEEDKKSYTILRMAINFIAILSLNFLSDKMGTIHIGLLALFLLVFISSDYIIKNVIKKQPILWKYEIIQWSMGIFILFIIIIF